MHAVYYLATLHFFQYEHLVYSNCSEVLTPSKAEQRIEHKLGHDLLFCLRVAHEIGTKDLPGP